jgi:hypothetical protein
MYMFFIEKFIFVPKPWRSYPIWRYWIILFYFQLIQLYSFLGIHILVFFKRGWTISYRISHMDSLQSLTSRQGSIGAKTLHITSWLTISILWLFWSLLVCLIGLRIGTYWLLPLRSRLTGISYLQCNSEIVHPTGPLNSQLVFPLPLLYLLSLSH